MLANFDENIILVLTVFFLLLLEDKTVASRNVSFELCNDFRNGTATVHSRN
jgi:hypothetical protein